MSDRVKRPRHPQPMQPIVRATDGVVRFQSNAIVEHIVDLLVGSAGHRGAIVSADGKRIEYADLIAMPWSDADRDQFNQLHGYSVSGLPYRNRALAKRANAVGVRIAKRARRKR